MDDTEQSYATAPQDAAVEHAVPEKPKRTRGKKKDAAPDVFEEAIDQRLADAKAAQTAAQAEFQAGHHEPHHVENAERPKPPAHETHAERHAPAEQGKPWIQRFGHWKNNDAGVRLEEDRKHGISTILSRDPLPEQALVILEDRGFEEDRGAGGFSKKLDRWRPADSREQALETVKDVANVILAEKGLPEMKSAYLSRS